VESNKGFQKLKSMPVLEKDAELIPTGISDKRLAKETRNIFRQWNSKTNRFERAKSGVKKAAE
jgi:hypothetical protein